MKSLFFKLSPGVLACLAVALGVAWSHAQSPAGSLSSIPPQAAPPTYYAQPVERPSAVAAAPQVLVCGSCGAQLLAPQAVYIAAPVGGRPAGPVPGQSFYGIPPVGFISGATYGPECYDGGAYRPAVNPVDYYPVPNQWRPQATAAIYRPAPQRGHFRH